MNNLQPGQVHATGCLRVCVRMEGGGGHLGYQFTELRFTAVLCVVLLHRGGLIFLRHSASKELIIGQHTARSLPDRCRRAQAAKSSPYCAYSPHLRSLCCAMHSGPPVQLFLYKKLQNSILWRERGEKEGQTMGGCDKKHLKMLRIQTVNVMPWLLQSRKETKWMRVWSLRITLETCDRIFLAPTVRWCTQLM